MSRKTPVTEYETTVKKSGSSAYIQAFHAHIGKKAKVSIMEVQANENISVQPREASPNNDGLQNNSSSEASKPEPTELRDNRPLDGS